MKGFALKNSEMACNQSIRNNGENTRIIYFFFLVFFFFFFDKLITPKKSTANQVGWRQLHYKNKNCNNITVKQNRF